MLMNRQDMISLKNLCSAKDLVPVERIPVSFKDDFQRFFFGKTLVKQDSHLFAYPHDVKMWVRFVFSKYND